jgi:bifunctional UDP-N-acetylglucosamine pyrophosphorylase/glucosamine-1-phosphate N-acetyltransferase
MIVVILAAGRGERMQLSFPGIPKPFVPIGQIPMIIRLLHTLISIPECNSICIMVPVGKRHLFQKEIGRYISDRTFVFIEQKPEYGYGTASALQAFVDSYTFEEYDIILILNSDSPFIRKETILRMKMEKYLFNNDLLVGTGFVKDPTGYGRIFFTEKGTYEIIEEKELEKGQNTNHVNGGVYMVSGNLLLRVKTIEPSVGTGEKKLTDLIKFSESLGIFGDLDSFEILNINSPFDKIFVEYLLLNSIKKW